MKYADLKKRGISGLLAAVMLASSLPETNAYAANERRPSVWNPEFAHAAETPKEEDVSMHYLKKKGASSQSGYQDMAWIDEDGNEVEVALYEPADAGTAYGLRESFPSAYNMADLEELPAVRNQGRWGTCWAHAALSSIETNMVKKGLADASDVDYSERHLAYFAHKRNETLGDGEDHYHDTYGWYGGGNYYQAIAELSGWYGPAAERDYPYASYDDMEALEESQRSSAVCHLTDASLLRTPEEIKRAVMENGAVMCSFYSGDGTLGTAEVNVYHAEPHDTDHAVSIVGWDDDYPNTKFSDGGRIPAGNGAWRCRNSWGGNWAEDGYFWISYEDATIVNFCSFEADTAEDYDNIYQYDGASWNISISYEKGANVFRAKTTEELKAISFYAKNNYDYVIEIYAEGEEEMTLPSDGLLVCRQEGSLAYPGYHVIPLEKSVLLESGMKYAAAIKLMEKDGGDGYICMEIGDAYSAEAGQSFIYHNRMWKDTADTEKSDLKNVCVKAFTDHAAPVDKTKLLQALKECEQENLTESDYTASTWAEYMERKNAAEDLYQSANPSEREMIRAILNLKSARTALRASVVLIADEYEFVKFIKEIEAGDSYEEQTVRLLCDLDMEGMEYDVLRYGQNPFQGTFDGGGHAIANLSYAYAYSYGGLFGHIGEAGVIKNLTLSDAALELSGSYSGGIAGINAGTIEGCSVTGDRLTFAASNTGGIVGSNKGAVEGCSVEGAISFNADAGQFGGIAGYNEGRIEQSYVDGSIWFRNQTNTGSFVGGIAGYNNGTIEKCYASGALYSHSMVSVGGIAGYGYPESSIRLCYNLASIEGTPGGDVRTGGIGVCLYGTTSDCYNYGQILRTAGEAYGAIYVYKGSGTVSNCYYLDASSTKGGYSPRLSEGSLTAEEFASAKAAYYLNSSGGKGENTYAWSQSQTARLPIWADEENEAVVRALVRQKEGSEGRASLNGVTEGEWYGNAGTAVRLSVLQEENTPGYLYTAEASGLIRAEDGEDIYRLPKTDTVAELDCRKTRIDYKITYHLNRGIGAGPETYHVESQIELPTPVKEGAEFLGWYDNEECLGEPVSIIPIGSTGNKEFWAKWHREGYEVVFPQKKGYEIESCEGYINGKIQDDGSYLFRIRAADGYDASGLIITRGGTPLLPDNGVYRIDHITSDIEDISIEGILLGAGNYSMDTCNGYVGETCVIRPSAPASGIKLAEDSEFQESLTVSTDEEIQIQTCDEEENVSGPETIRFRQDLNAPEFVSKEILPDGAGKYVSGFYIAIHAADEESGISEYSFDNGLSWQKENRYYVPCKESAFSFAQTILIRDYVGNTLRYDLETEIPAAVKCGSSITLRSEKAAYLLGSDVRLTAEAAFEEDVKDAAGYGTVRFLTSDGAELGASEVKKGSGAKGTAELVLPKTALAQSGERVFRAVYDGTSTIFRNSESNACRVRIAAAAIQNPVFPDAEVARGSEKAAGAGILGEDILPTSGTVEAGGRRISYRVAWDASITLDLTKEGSAAVFVGTIAYKFVPDEILQPESLIVKRKVSVKKSSAVLPDQKPVFQNGAEEIIGSGCYRVIDKKKKTAALARVTAPNITTLIVPSTVKICGVTCKVVQIGAQAAKGLRKLKKAVLGKNVSVIGKQAFFGCKKLKTVQIKGKTIKKVNAGALKKTAAKLTVFAKKMNKRQKQALFRKLRRAGMGKKGKVK